METISTELLFLDVTKQIVALNELVEAVRVVELLPPVGSVFALRKRLSRLLGRVWKECWIKAKPKKHKPPAPKKGTLADALGVALLNISHHLMVLRHAGLVRNQRQGRFIFYSLPSAFSTQT